MKNSFFTLLFALTSFFAFAQETETQTETDGENHKPSTSPYKYFLSTNSGIQNTPVGFRIGILDRMGGYLGARFGKGYKYKEQFATVTKSEATLFAANAGLIFPIANKKTFKVHTFLGLGFGKWFDRPSQNGQTIGIELEGGLMLSYQWFMLNFGGNFLTGDGKSPKKDMTVGIGFRF